MGMEDRDWYREDFKRRQAIQPRPSAQSAPQQLPVRSNGSQLPNLGAGSILIFCLFLLAVFAVGSIFV